MPNDSSVQGPERLAATEIWERVFQLMGDTRCLSVGVGAELAMKLTTYSDVLRELHALRAALVRGDAGDAPRAESNEQIRERHVDGVWCENLRCGQCYGSERHIAAASAPDGLHAAAQRILDHVGDYYDDEPDSRSVGCSQCCDTTFRVSDLRALRAALGSAPRVPE